MCTQTAMAAISLLVRIGQVEQTWKWQRGCGSLSLDSRMHLLLQLPLQGPVAQLGIIRPWCGRAARSWDAAYANPKAVFGASMRHPLRTLAVSTKQTFQRSTALRKSTSTQGSPRQKQRSGTKCSKIGATWSPPAPRQLWTACRTRSCDSCLMKCHQVVCPVVCDYS